MQSSRTQWPSFHNRLDMDLKGSDADASTQARAQKG